MTTKRGKTDRDDAGYDAKKAKEIFARKLADDASGRRTNSQMKRDADLILTLLRDGEASGARMTVFTATFEDLFSISRESAGARCRAAIKFLREQNQVSPNEDKHPVYSLKQNG
ncbi:hypothetical protein [Agrobacterium tumefaciens]|uniref:hypothetical protein n=1 Tax=Agrobacterium tumefaciens TaxID=358 RepID=UPI001572932D|nr:hypothetical protein [Agrobacterium tumefaciens]NSX94422.1 hypothetical protein [Agrobacterium tumefaciens]